MIELTIKTDNKEALQQLLQFIATLDFKIVKKEGEKISILQGSGKGDHATDDLPVDWAAEPEKAKELFGIWKDNPKNLDEVRQLAWGDRL